ncbi:hypothetical protein EV421DRAFT_1912614 [Armillaria borealis]|uniref:Uncharacterized protein n=1 Tax=Armillaria borealis TaxID=47425 RepID=A0AA39IUE6_9AGAR|nr:hypothetical protein EV421DRAFT_1912614 [Armillaria borealis]
MSKKEGSFAMEKSQMCGQGCKPAKVSLVKVLTTPLHKGVTPPPAVISEDTYVDIWGHSLTPVTTEYLLECMLTDVPLLLEVRDNVSPLAQAAHPFIEMHDHNFMAADC